MADSVPRTGDSRGADPHARRVVRQSASERRRTVRDGARRRTVRSVSPVCPPGFRVPPGRVAGPARSWARIPPRCSKSLDSPTSPPVAPDRETGGLRDGQRGRRAARRAARAGGHPCARRLPRRVHRRPGRPRDGPALLPAARRRGLLCMSWPEEFGGGGRVGVGADRGARGDVGPPRAARRAVHGRQLGRPDDHAPRHRRAAAQAPPAHRARRGDLVPGLQRARGRLRPRLAADHGAPRRRRLADHRPEDLDVLRHHGAVVLPARPHLARGEKKQQGLTIFLVPMADPAIEVRPIRCMLGPHHLNEVFFDDLRVTEADVLGDGRRRLVDRAGRAGVRAGRHRPLRPLRAAAAAAPAVLGDRWDDLPAELRGRWARMLTHCRRARLLAYRVVVAAEQRTGQARRRRGLPDRGDQARPGQRRGADGDRRRGVARRPRRRLVPRRGRGPLALLAGVHRLLGQHRDAAHPAVPRPAGGAEMAR